MSRPKTNFTNSIMLVVIGVLVVAVVMFLKNDQKAEVVTIKPATAVNPYPGLDLDDPAASYQVLRYVVDQGGDARTRELAINWLDLQSRRQLPLDQEKEQWLIDTLAANGHGEWDSEYRFWIFNSAFNVLQLGQKPEAFTRLLQKLALEDSHKTMRLYALQHIELQRADGKLTGPLAAEIRDTLYVLANQRKSQTAGTALTLLVDWEGSETPASPELIELALKLAADSTSPVDIRVTAIHAVDEKALKTARILAADSTQPVLVRKASIACIGRYGNQADTPKLENLSAENFRIAQAAQPALRALRTRLSNGPKAAPVPF